MDDSKWQWLKNILSKLAHVPKILALVFITWCTFRYNIKYLEKDSAPSPPISPWAYTALIAALFVLAVVATHLQLRRSTHTNSLSE